MNWTRTTTVRWRRPPVRPPTRPGGWPDRIDPRAAIPCRLYWIYGPDPRTDPPVLVLVYVGEVVDTPNRGPLVRFAEHMEDKPWADTIPERDPHRALAAGILRTSDSTYPCKQAVQAVERAAIVHGRPLYNYEHNLNNPDRISIPEQRAARAARDAANRVPADQTWVAQDARRQAARAATHIAGPAHRARWTRIVRGRRTATRRFGPRTRRRLGWFSVWGLASLLVWALAAWFAPVMSLPRLAVLSAGLAGLALARIHRPRRRGWKRAGNTAIMLAIGALMLLTARTPLAQWVVAGG